MTNHGTNAVLRRLASSLERAMLVVFVTIDSVLLFLTITGAYNQTQFRATIGDAGEALLFYVTILLLALLLILGSMAIESLSERGLRRMVIALFGLMATLMCVMVTQFRVLPITDGYAMLDQARYLAENPGSVVDASSPYYVYFGRYGNNYFLTAVFVYVYRILMWVGLEDPILPLVAVNAASIMIGNYLGYRIALEGLGKRRAVRALLLLTVNPLSYTMVWWVYSCTLSIPLMTGIVLLVLRAYREKTLARALPLAVICGILGALSYFVRPTSLIPLVAAGLLAVVLCLGRPHEVRRAMALAVTCCIALVMFLGLFPAVYEPFFGEELRASNYPVTHWLMMGSHGSGGYDATDEAYTLSFDTHDEKVAATVSRTADNYRELGVSGTMVHLVRKVGVTFADGLSQSDVRLGQDSRFSPLFRYLAYDRNGLFVLYCQAFRVLTVGMMLLFGVEALRHGRPEPALMLCAVSFMGGIVFYCLWEAKSVYSVPFVPLMLICSECGLGRMACVSREICADIVPASRRRIVLASAVAWCLVSISSFYALCGAEYSLTALSQRFYDRNFCDRFDGFDEVGATIDQSFYSRDGFDRLTLYVRVAGDGNELARYGIQVIAPDGAVVHSSEADASDVVDGTLAIYLGDVSPGEEGAYHVIIEVLGHGEREIAFLHRRSLAFDQYPGTSFVNGGLTPYDLAMTVGRALTSPFTSVRAFAVLFALGAATIIAAFRALGLMGPKASETMPRHWGGSNAKALEKP